MYAVAEIVNYTTRLADNKDKLSAHFDRLKMHKDELKDDGALVSIPVENDREIDRRIEENENVDEMANAYGHQVKTNCRRCGRYGCDGGYRCPENPSNKNRSSSWLSC